jgi:hypothetical protein
MSKKQYFVISSLVIIALIGLVWSVLLLMEPKAIPKIKWSSIKTEERIREGLGHILKPQIEQSQFVILGVPSDELKWIRISGLVAQKIQVLKPRLQIWAAEELIEVSNFLEGSAVKTFSMKDSPAASYSDLGKVFLQDQDSTLLVLTGLLDASSFNEEGRGGWLRANQKKSIHLLFADVIPNREQESEALLPCDTSGKKFAVGRLGCEILNLSRLNYRKIKKTEGLGFATSQISERDVLTVVKVPSQINENIGQEEGK